jgi:prophage maintenance system killer protein
MREPRWIIREACLVLYETMLLRYSVAGGVRDSAVLDAILARPKERFAAGPVRVTTLAACYAVGIVLDRPFTSGNLAIGFLIATTFLGSNSEATNCDSLRQC